MGSSRCGRNRAATYIKHDTISLALSLALIASTSLALITSISLAPIASISFVLITSII
jgi:hypothetical protein